MKQAVFPGAAATLQEQANAGLLSRVSLKQGTIVEFGQRPDSKRRLVGISFVVVLHVALLYALVFGLGNKVLSVLPPPIQMKILDEPAPETKPPPPPPPPQLETPPPLSFVPPPEVVIAQPPPPAAITATTTVKPVEQQPSQRSSQTAPVVKARNCREPSYPAASERLGETGTVVLALMVGVDGKVTNSRVDRSSGYPRLDKAAQDALSRCTFTPGTSNGVPEPAWASIKYTFKTVIQ